MSIPVYKATKRIIALDYAFVNILLKWGWGMWNTAFACNCTTSSTRYMRLLKNLSNISRVAGVGTLYFLPYRIMVPPINPPHLFCLCFQHPFEMRSLFHKESQWSLCSCYQCAKVPADSEKAELPMRHLFDSNKSVGKDKQKYYLVQHSF
jgi:hypothetical protein